jgi:hypothetical protein
MAMRMTSLMWLEHDTCVVTACSSSREGSPAVVGSVRTKRVTKAVLKERYEGINFTKTLTCYMRLRHRHLKMYLYFCGQYLLRQYELRAPAVRLQTEQ